MASSKKSNGIVSTIWGSPARINLVKAEKHMQSRHTSGLCGRDMSRDAIRSRIDQARANGFAIVHS